MSGAIWVQGLAGVVPPALVAGALLGLGWGTRRRRGPERSAGPPGATRAAWSLAVGLGYLAGHAAIHRALPPLSLQLDVKETLAWSALAGAAVGLALAWRLRAGVLLGLFFSLALPWVLLDFLRAGRWSTAEAVLATALLGGALAASAGSQETLAGRAPGLPVPLAWLLVAPLSAGALVYGGSASLGQLAGCLGALALPAALLALRRPGLRLDGGGALGLSSLHGGLLLAGHFAADLPWASALLLALAPHAAWILPAVEPRGAARRLAAASGGVLGLALSGLAIAALSAPAGPPAG